MSSDPSPVPDDNSWRSVWAEFGRWIRNGLTWYLDGMARSVTGYPHGADPEIPRKATRPLDESDARKPTGGADRAAAQREKAPGIERFDHLKSNSRVGHAWWNPNQANRDREDRSLN
jgi:hypothetical protein